MNAPEGPLQYPRPHGSGIAFRSPAGLSDLAGRKRDRLRCVHQETLPKPLRPNQLSYWQNYEKFHVSLMKAWFGDAAAKGNNWCFDWLPKLDKLHDVLQVFEDMYQGRMNGYLCQGFNAAGGIPQQGEAGCRAGQAEVPRRHGPSGHRNLRILAQFRSLQ